MKKLLIISLCINILLVSVYAIRRINRPAPIADSPSIWQTTRTDIFAALPRDTGSIIFLGDSITEGFPVSEYFPGVKNRGVNGSEVVDILNRAHTITALQPSKVFIMAGINDIKNGVPLASSLKLYRMLVDTITKGSPKTKIFIQPVLVWGAMGHRSGRRNTIPGTGPLFGPASFWGMP